MQNFRQHPMLQRLQLERLELFFRALIEQRWLPYYQGLAEREQRLLQVSEVVLPMLILVFAIVLPIHDAWQSKQSVAQKLHVQVQEAESLALRLQSQGNQPQQGNLMTQVDQLARQAQVRTFMTRIRPQPAGDREQRLLLQMQDAPYQKVVDFFAMMAKNGIGLEQVKLQKSEKNSYVHVQATVEL